MISMEHTTRRRVSLLESNSIPQHIGIIMDGNGRWAESRGLPRTAGHKEGLIAAKRVVKAAREAGVPYLSLYTFSTENWQRTKEEVSFLMGLLSTHLRREFDFYREHQIRVIHSGSLQGLPDSVISEIADVTQDTQNHKGLTVNLAINYGGRDEISRAAKKLLEDFSSDLSDLIEGNHQPAKSMVTPLSTDPRMDQLRQIIQGFTETKLKELDTLGFQEHLDHPELPDLDLIIRSGGEQRLSNFLLWQSSYAEFIFDPRFWPDWDEDVFYDVLETFQSRQRRFGGV
jgi:undecaprenyl diphosphate synthase